MNSVLTTDDQEDLVHVAARFDDRTGLIREAVKDPHQPDLQIRVITDHSSFNRIYISTLISDHDHDHHLLLADDIHLTQPPNHIFFFIPGE